VVAGELADVHPVLSRCRMPERLQRAVVRLEPAGGASVQAGDLVGRLVAQLRAQQLGEQGMEPVPGPPLADRGQQRVIALEPRENARGVGAPGHLVGQVRVRGVEDRQSQQVVAYVGRLLREHLGEQVVGDRAVDTGELGDERGRVRVRAHRERREPQAGRPAFGALPQRLGDVAGHVEARHREQLLGLGERERKVGHADLGQRAGDAEPANAERRVDARRDDEPERGRRMP
jgi:hypothetical protein